MLMSVNHLLSFDKSTRRVWMFPRNIRDIEPWKLHQILIVFMEYTQTSDMSSQQVQDLLYSILASIGIKREAMLRDPKSGGMRTYFAQLECLGLVYKISKKSYEFTIAGEMMRDGIETQKVLQVALLRHQYPSSYSIGQNIKIDQRIKIKPFIFILMLLHDERLAPYITSEEIQIPVIYGHNYNCYEFCLNKILEMRAGKKFKQLVDNPSHDLYTPRGSGSLHLAYKNVSDIANTAKNYLQAAGLLICDLKKASGKERYFFNDAFEDVYISELEKKDDYIRYPENKESFQRAYGRFDKVKDTREVRPKTRKQNSGAETLIQLKCIEYMKNNPFSADFVTDYCNEMGTYGFSRDQVTEVINPLLARKATLEESVYLEYANSGGVKATEFEKATTTLLQSLGFNKAVWIGSKKTKLDRRGGFPDIYIAHGDNDDCGMADTKASVAYSLNHKDMLVLSKTYFGSNKEINPSSSLKYFVYIAGGFKGNVQGALEELFQKIKIPVTAVTAQALLDIKHNSKYHNRPEIIEEKIFKSKRLITSVALSYSVDWH